MNFIQFTGHVLSRKYVLTGMVLRVCVAVLIVLLGACSAKQDQRVEENDAQAELNQQQTKEYQEPGNDKSLRQYSSKQNHQQPASAKNPVSDATGKVLTEQEQAAQLEDKLDTTLREFDDMLLKNNQRVSDSVPGGRATARGSIATHQGNQAGSSQLENNAERTEDMSGSGQAIAGTKQPVLHTDSDDVVARQIREAAEKESDPELKKKLWAEYKRYKSGSN